MPNPRPQLFLVQKAGDEGTSTPFVARVSLGFLELRDYALEFGQTIRRAECDRELMPLLAFLAETRFAAKRIAAEVARHEERLRAGTITERQPAAVILNESIDDAIGSDLGTLLERGYGACKRIQTLVGLFGINIGCTFQRDQQFASGCKVLAGEGHGALAEYLKATRQAWSAMFMGTRVAFTHDGWRPDRCQYVFRGDGSLGCRPPSVNGTGIVEYALESADMRIGFAEDVFAYAVQSSFTLPVVIREIAPSEMDPAIAKRFTMDFVANGFRPWTIKFQRARHLV